MATTLTALSPRISFSHEDLDLSLPSADDSPRRLGDDDDFDFSVSLDAISIHDHLFSPADHLFSHGKLLPLSLSSLNLSTPQPVPVKLETKELTTNSSSSSTPKSFWNSTTIGRSSSVGAAASSSKARLSSICPFPRSKSTGSSRPKMNQKQQVRNRNSNTVKNGGYYYSYSGSGKRSGSYAAGVMISPVINVPTHFIPRGGSTTSSGGSSTSSGGGSRSVTGIFAYLLCNCRDKNGKELVCGGEI